MKTKHWPTVEQLLTHTSGFPQGDESAVDEYQVEEINCFEKITRKDLIEQINELQLEDKIYQPVYSNIGSAAIGLILERIYGRSYKELLYDLFNRYGMTNTKIDATGDIGLPGIGQDGRTCSNWRWPESCAFSPAGAIISNPEDMMKYAAHILQQADPAVRLALTPIQQFSMDGDKPVIKIGYFWIYLQDYHIYFHNGGSGCFNSMLAIDRKTNTVILFLSNCYLEEKDSFILSELLHLR